MLRRANGTGQAGKWWTKPSTGAVYEGLTGHSVLYTKTIPYVVFQESTHARRGTVFCPGFQKGRVPSEKGTLARWTDRQKGTLARWTDRQKGTLARWTEEKGHN